MCYDGAGMDAIDAEQDRARRRRAPGRRDGPAAPPAAPQGPAAARRPAPAPARAVEVQGSVNGPAEQVWERTHLEQTMFQLAREHADAAARCAQARPADRQGEQTHSLVAVLMSYFALEAFINMVGSDRLGDRFRHYDRMSPEGKWIEVTRLASKTGRTFAEDGEEMRGLSTLRSWRNTLTHYKGEYEDVQQTGHSGETRIAALLSADNASRAVEIARTLYRAFYALDRRSPPRQLIWLDDRAHARQQARPQEAAPAAAPSPRVEAVRVPVPVSASAGPVAASGRVGAPEAGDGAPGRPRRRRRPRRSRRAGGAGRSPAQ